MKRFMNISKAASALVIALSLASCGGKTIGYYGDDLSGLVSVERDMATKEATLTIETGQPWKIYAGDRVETIDMSKPIAKGLEDGTFGLPVDNGRRWYFQVESDGDGMVFAERRLPMEGGFNFRDMGGYKTKDGRFVKWGKIFRTDDMHNLTQADLEYLAYMGLVSVVDFRALTEVEEAPDRLPISVHNYYKYPIIPGSLNTFEELSRRSTAEIEKLMEDMNVFLVSDPAIVETYKNFFALLQDESKIPLSFHCSAGKDRTGIGAALILYALGVDEGTIIEDYMLSNRYLTKKYQAIVEKYPTLKPLFEVRPEFIAAGLRKIKDTHGSVENYLVNVLHVDIQKFREMYLY